MKTNSSVAKKKKVLKEEKQILLIIAKIRKERGITQKKLAQLSGISQPNIVRFEKGTNSPTLGTLIRILKPLGYTINVKDSSK